jgi:hypothetical protein
MATLLPNSRIGSQYLKGYRVFLFSHDHPHPPHVHFGRRKTFSSWDLTRLECTDAGGFTSRELAVQKSLLATYRDEIVRSWHEHWKRQGQIEGSR